MKVNTVIISIIFGCTFGAFLVMAALMLFCLIIWMLMAILGIDFLIEPIICNVKILWKILAGIGIIAGPFITYEYIKTPIETEMVPGPKIVKTSDLKPNKED